MEKRYSIRISVSEKTRRELRILAAKQNTTMTELFRDAMQEYCKARGIEIDLTDGLDERGGYRERKPKV